MHGTLEQGTIIAPSMLSELCRDIGDSEYSLIIDESTDISMKKSCVAVVRYPNNENKRIITSFLRLVELERYVIYS